VGARGAGRAEGSRKKERGRVLACTLGSSLPPVTEAARWHCRRTLRDDGRRNDGCTGGSRDPFDEDIGIVMPAIRGVFAIALHCRCELPWYNGFPAVYSERAYLFVHSSLASTTARPSANQAFDLSSSPAVGCIWSGKPMASRPIPLGHTTSHTIRILGRGSFLVVVML
jgi:hypothetical protein